MWRPYSDQAMTTDFNGNALIAGSTASDFNPDTDASVDTSTAASVTIYIKANLLGKTETVSKEFTIAVCDGETVSLAGPSEHYLRFEKGSTATVGNF